MNLLKATRFSFLLIMITWTFFISCKEQEKNIENHTEINQSKPDEFSFEAFIIGKDHLGPIQKRMTIAEAEKNIKGLERKTTEAGNFGIDGGGVAYSYYLKNDLVFALVPQENTDTIIYILAVHPSLKTNRSISANASVADLLKHFPDLVVTLDLMNGGEIFWDEKNNHQYYFSTEEENKIGIYSDPDAPSKPYKKDVKSDWILISLKDID